MQHDFSIVFDTENPLWIRVLEIFEKNEKYEKKVVSNRNLHHKFPRSFSKKIGEPVDNDKDNLISLTLADHFLVHYYYYILARKGYRQPMATAFTFMAKKGIKFMTPETAEAMAKDYEEAKVISVQFHRTEEYRNKMSASIKKLYENDPGYVDKIRPKIGRKLSDDTKRKMSESAKNSYADGSRGIEQSENQKGKAHPHKGGFQSDEKKRKLKIASVERNTGRKWYTDGVNNKFCKEPPEGFTLGRIYTRDKYNT